MPHRRLADLIPDDVEVPEAPEEAKPSTPAKETPKKAPRKRKPRAARKKEMTEPEKPNDENEEKPAPSEPKPEPPHVLATDTKNSNRLGLYLHPDDYRALGIAKLDDGADANARIRAMIALWRANARYRAQVDRLARTAPRGGRTG